MCKRVGYEEDIHSKANSPASFVSSEGSFEELCSPSLFLSQKTFKYIVRLKGKEMTVKKDSVTSKKQDSGSSEFQITVFTNRIKNLTEHLKLNKKDHNTRRGLMRLVGKRKKLLSYIKSKSNERYESIVKSLGLRR